MGRDQLINEAAAAERLAAVVTHAADRAELLKQAGRLRQKAAALEERSWPRGNGGASRSRPS